MKKRKLLLIGLLIWNFNSVLSQSCGTPHPINPTIYPQEDTNLQARGSSSALCIDVFFHIVRNTNGTNTFTIPNLDAIVNDLNEFYSLHNIIINNAGSDFINNSNFVNIDNDTEARNLGQTNNRNDAINYYIVETLWNVNGGFITGTANSIPSNNLVIRRDRVLTSTSPHELGHCLNLLHTHETAKGVEAINGSNCSTTGDLVCDTPADSGQGTVNGYNPDLTNLMSYYHNFGFTLDHFTNGQGHRMRYAIQNESVLQNIRGNSCTSISEVNNVCYPQTTNITLSNLEGAITTWTSSNNVQIVSSNNSSAQIRAANSSSTGSGWIRASVNNGIEFLEEFEIGVPNVDLYKVYNASLNGNYTLLNNRVWNHLDIYHDFSLPAYYQNPSPFSYKWVVTATSGMIRANSSGLPRATISPNENHGTIQIGIKAENECGCSPWKWQTFSVNGVNNNSSGGILNPE
jgi:hypothetical protein